MKIRLIIACAIGVLFAVSSCSSDVQRALTKQLETYPASTVQDVYKTFYQDRFGSEHMIRDTAAVRRYLSYELEVAASDSIPNPYYEPTGAEGRFVRVFLRGVNEGLITEEELLNAFLRSAKPTAQPEQTWAEQWAQILACLDKNQLNQLDPDSVLPELQIAAETERAVHHSNSYRQAYHPHYRIVEKSIFERELRPRLDAHLPVR